MKTTSTTEIFVGIDVSKDTLDVFITGINKQLHLSNDIDGYKILCRRLKKLSPKVIVLEGTGGLEKCAASWMSLKGFPVAIVNPRQVRRYAQAHNILAKTDRIDANVLAGFAKDIAPEARYVVDKERFVPQGVPTLRSDPIWMLLAIPTMQMNGGSTSRQGVARIAKLSGFQTIRFLVWVVSDPKETGGPTCWQVGFQDGT